MNTKISRLSEHSFPYSDLHTDEETVFRPIKMRENTILLQPITISSTYSVYFLHVKSFIATCFDFLVHFYSVLKIGNLAFLFNIAFYVTLGWNIIFVMLQCQKPNWPVATIFCEWGLKMCDRETEGKTEKTLSKTVYQGRHSTFSTQLTTLGSIPK